MGNIIMALIVAIVVLGSCSNNKKSNSEDKTTTPTIKTKDTIKANNELATKYLSTEDFKKKIMNYDEHPQEWVFEGNRPAIIDFYATWCGPCKMIAPIVKEIADEYDGKILVGKVNVDEEPDLTMQYNVSSIPTLMVFKNGQLVNKAVGYREKDEILKMLK